MQIDECNPGTVVKAKPSRCGGIPKNLNELLELIKNTAGLSKEQAEQRCRSCLAESQGADSPAGKHDCGQCDRWTWLGGLWLGSPLPTFGKAACTKTLTFPKNPCRAIRIPRIVIEQLIETAGLTNEAMFIEELVIAAAGVLALGSITAEAAMEMIIDYIKDNFWVASGSLSARSDVKVDCTCEDTVLQ